MGQNSEECRPGEVCVIDTKQLLKERQKEEPKSKKNSVLIFLTKGTYGHDDDGFGAISMANAMLAKEQDATILLLDDGVYFAVKAQDPSAIGLPNNIQPISDFLELGGRILALKPSLEQRCLSNEEMIDCVEIIEKSQIVREVERHRVSLTF